MLNELDIKVVKKVIKDIGWDSLAIYIYILLNTIIEKANFWSEILEEIMFLIFITNLKCFIISARKKQIDIIFYFSVMFAFASVILYVLLAINVVEVNVKVYNIVSIILFVISLGMNIVMECKIAYINKKIKEEKKLKQKKAQMDKMSKAK